MHAPKVPDDAKTLAMGNGRIGRHVEATEAKETPGSLPVMMRGIIQGMMPMMRLAKQGIAHEREKNPTASNVDADMEGMEGILLLLPLLRRRHPLTLRTIEDVTADTIGITIGIGMMTEDRDIGLTMGKMLRKMRKMRYPPKS